MKKTIFLTAIFSLFFFVGDSQAVMTRVTLKVESVKVPTRAIALGRTDNPEFILNSWDEFRIMNGSQMVSSIRGIDRISAGKQYVLTFDKQSGISYIPRLTLIGGQFGYSNNADKYSQNANCTITNVPIQPSGGRAITACIAPADREDCFGKGYCPSAFFGGETSASQRGSTRNSIYYQGQELNFDFNAI